MKDFKLMILIGVLGIALLFMNGCGADYGRVKIDNKGFEIEAGQGSDETEHKHDKPKHCPPGHRKKGWC